MFEVARGVRGLERGVTGPFERFDVALHGLGRAYLLDRVIGLDEHQAWFVVAETEDVDHGDDPGGRPVFEALDVQLHIAAGAQRDQVLDLLASVLPQAPAAVSTPVSGISGSSQAEGTTLNSELNTASSTAAAGSVPRIRRALARLRALGGVDGEFTFHNSTGYHTLAFERGTVQSVSGSQVVVRAPDGTTWTWLIVSDTVVRQNGSKTTTSALATGQTVFAGGPVVGGAKDARLIVIRPGSASGSSSSGSVSGPSGTSVS